MSSQLDPVRSGFRPHEGSTSIPREPQVKYESNVSQGITDREPAPGKETMDGGSKISIPPNFGRELYLKLASLEEDESDEENPAVSHSISPSSVSSGQYYTPKEIEASSHTSAEGSTSLSPDKGVVKREFEDDEDLWIDEEDSVCSEEEHDTTAPVPDAPPYERRSNQGLEIVYDRIRDGTPPATVSCSHQLPLDWDSAHTTDKLIMKWREQGIPWPQVNLKWVEITGHHVNKCTLSNRFQRLKHIKRPVFERSSIAAQPGALQSKSSPSHATPPAHIRMVPRRLTGQRNSLKSHRSGTQPPSKHIAHKFGWRPADQKRRFCSFCNISAPLGKWSRHMQTSKHRRNVLLARDGASHGDIITDGPTHVPNTQHRRSSRAISSLQQPHSTMSKRNPQPPMKTFGSNMLIDVKRRRCELCGVKVLRKKFKQHEETLKHQVNLIDRACGDDQIEPNVANIIGDKLEKRSLLGASSYTKPKNRRCDICKTTQMTSSNLKKHLMTERHRYLISSTEGDELVRPRSELNLEIGNDKDMDSARTGSVTEQGRGRDQEYSPAAPNFGTAQCSYPRCEAHNTCAEEPRMSANLVRVVSEFFGKPKNSAYRLPEDVWIFWCASHKDQAQRGGSWPLTQLKLLDEQLRKIEERYLVRSWVLNLKPKTVERLRAEDARALARSGVTLTGDAPCWERFLVPYLGPHKKFAEVRGLLNLLMEKFESEEPLDGMSRAVKWAGFELTPTLRADHDRVVFRRPSIRGPNDSTLKWLHPRRVIPNDGAVGSSPKEPPMREKRPRVDRESTASEELTVSEEAHRPSYDSGGLHSEPAEPCDMVFEAQESNAHKRRKLAGHDDFQPSGAASTVKHQKWVTIPCKKRAHSSALTAPNKIMENPVSQATVVFGDSAPIENRFSTVEGVKGVTHTFEKTNDSIRPRIPHRQESDIDGRSMTVGISPIRNGFPSVQDHGKSSSINPVVPSAGSSSEIDQQNRRPVVIDLEEDDSMLDLYNRSNAVGLPGKATIVESSPTEIVLPGTTQREDYESPCSTTKAPATSGAHRPEAKEASVVKNSMVRTPHGTTVSSGNMKLAISMKRAWAKRLAEGRSGNKGGAPKQRGDKGIDDTIQSRRGSDIVVSPQAKRLRSISPETPSVTTDHLLKPASMSAPTTTEQQSLPHPSDQERLIAQKSNALESPRNRHYNRHYMVKDKDFNSLPDYAPSTANLANDTTVLNTNWRPAYGPLDLSSDMHRNKLHKAELRLAAALRLKCATYLCSKRRIFEAHREARRKHKVFTRTQAQRVCRISTTKSAELWTAFNRAGWFNQTYSFKPKKKTQKEAAPDDSVKKPCPPSKGQEPMITKPAGDPGLMWYANLSPAAKAEHRSQIAAACFGLDNDLSPFTVPVSPTSNCA